MRRPCNCKRQTQPKSFDGTQVPKLKAYWETHIEGVNYEDITFDDKQNLNIFFHNIYPLNNSTDGLFIYNKLKKLI